jgi:hypothetical protein
VSGSRVRSFRHGLGQPGSGRHGGIGVCVGCQDINGFHQPWRLSSGDPDRVFDMFFLDLYDKLCSFKGPSRRSFSWHSFSNSSNNTFGSGKHLFMNFTTLPSLLICHVESVSVTLAQRKYLSVISPRELLIAARGRDGIQISVGNRSEHFF